jgi:hypothetical protein
MLFGHLTGDPLYGFHIFQSHLSNDYLIKDTEDTSAWTYFVFLFVKVYHTGLLGPLALAAVISALRQPDDHDVRFVLIWACGLLLAFSILPISFSPLKFVPKQTNYIAIFMMPFALLTGWFLARQRLRVKIVLGGALLGSSIILAAMEQQTIRVVTANADAARNFVSLHPDVPVFGSETVERQSSLYRLLGGSLDGSKDIHKLADIKDIALGNGAPNETVAYAIDDPQVVYWAGARKESAFTDKIRRCGSSAVRLPLSSDLGWGRPIVKVIYDTIGLLPSPFSNPLHRQFEPIYNVAAATVYALSRECVRSLATDNLNPV